MTVEVTLLLCQDASWWQRRCRKPELVPKGITDVGPPSRVQRARQCPEPLGIQLDSELSLPGDDTSVKFTHVVPVSLLVSKPHRPSLSSYVAAINHLSLGSLVPPSLREPKKREGQGEREGEA